MIVLPRVMGHRGAAAAAPENTLAGLRAAARTGVAWVEFDVMLTGDGVPVLFHDDNLRRTTGRDAPMSRTPLAALRALEAGSWFAPEFAGEPVPTLEEALEVVLDLGLHANVEIKPTPGRDEDTAEAALGVIGRCWPGDRPPPLVSSFSRRALGAARRRAPDTPRGLIAWRLPRDWARAARALECATLHLPGNRLSERAARRIKGAGYGLAAFTVNDPAAARRLLAWGVDCIITDAPGAIAAALR
ncbi:MAG: glycerophosphodiester phosphodiesterase family protein [Kiloniellaceae bacterium]